MQMQRLTTGVVGGVLAGAIGANVLEHAIGGKKKKKEKKHKKEKHHKRRGSHSSSSSSSSDSD
jgi:Na+/glutamate symporter